MCGRAGSTELTPGSEREALCVCASDVPAGRWNFVSYKIWECGAQYEVHSLVSNISVAKSSILLR
jgi:hypothetical protein